MGKSSTIFRTIVSFVFAAGFGAGLEYILRIPTESLWYYVAVLIGYSFFTSFVVFDVQFRKPARFLFSIFSVLFASVSVLQLLLLPQTTIIHIFVGWSTFLFFLSFALFSPDAYAVVTAKNSSKAQIIKEFERLFHLYVMFILFYDILQIFEVARHYMWALIGIGVLFVIIQAWYYFWQQKQLGIQSVFYILLFGVVLFELFWITTLWPIHLAVRSMVLVALCYAMFGLLYQYQSSMLVKRVIYLQLAYSGFIIALIMGLSKWTLL